MSKRCQRCGEEKLLASFARASANKDGLRTWCRECQSAYDRARQSDPVWVEKRRAQAREYQRRTRTRRAEYKRARLKSPATRERDLAAARRRNKRYYETHKPEVFDHMARRRARKRGVYQEKVNRRAVIERDRWVCYLCGQPVEPGELSLDHVIPLAKGGPHIEGNVRVAHMRCNRKKGNKLLSEVKP